MKNFFDRSARRDVPGGEKLFQKGVPLFLLEIIRKYFRLEVVGVEHVPAKGKALIVPNHSSVTALDAVMIGNEIFRGNGRIANILAHPLWFVGPNIKVLASRMGLVEASKDAGVNLLKKNQAVIIFPEGEAGNFKPTSERYHLQDFRRGFVRIAMCTQAPIIPTVVIGAEETHINLSQLKLTRFLKGVIIPIPLNVIPLPAKWKIIFLPPIDMSGYTAEDASNPELVHKINNQVKTLIQDRINKELAKREWIYFPKGSSRASVRRKMNAAKKTKQTKGAAKPKKTATKKAK